MKRLVFAVLLVLAGAVTAQAAETIRCASTTSTQNSGLFDYLLPIFEQASTIQVQVIAVGTGAALELGKRGDVDVVFVHAKDDELALVREGWFVNRRDVMYNDFVLVGPLADPAGIRHTASAAAALAKVREAGASFVSRGDNSGTHKKEDELWSQEGKVPGPAAEPWYLSVGQGMAKTLRISAQKGAYSLTDRGSWLALRDKDGLDLAILLEGDPLLFNQYGVMAVYPERHPHVKSAEANLFIAWLVSPEGQKAIGSYRTKQGHALFVPNGAVKPYGR
jgi:tungstate transport system substrate-binding protein